MQNSVVILGVLMNLNILYASIRDKDFILKIKQEHIELWGYKDSIGVEPSLTNLDIISMQSIAV